MIKFSCPECKEPLEAPDELVGKILDCPKCNCHAQIPWPPGVDVEVGLFILAALLIVGGVIVVVVEHSISGVFISIAGVFLVVLTRMHRMIRRYVNRDGL